MDIFISYRREGGYAMARLLYEIFNHSGLSAFLDLEELRAGQFNNKLYEAIEKANNFILVLPKNGLDRCSMERDWVRLEIEHAIRLKKNIIPVMMTGFTFPETLPESLASLPYFNGVQASREYFDAAVSKILSMLVGVDNEKTSIKFNERHEDVRYYYDDDTAEKHRLRTEDALLGKYEDPIIKKLLEGKSNAVCLDVNVLNTEGTFTRLDYPEITKVIALTYNDDIVMRGNLEKGDRDVHFFKSDFNPLDFEDELPRFLKEAGVECIDVVYLSMAIMDFKKPFKILQAIRDCLNDDAVMLIRDVDDGAVFAYPDENGYFEKFQSFYIHNIYSGYRYTGRQIYSYVRKMDAKSITLEKYGINTSDMSRQDKRALFETWFSFIPNDFSRMLAEDPSSKIAKEVLDFCEEYYDDLNEQFFSKDAIFSAGYVIYSVRF